MKYLIFAIIVLIVAVSHGYYSMPPMPNLRRIPPVQCGAVTDITKPNATNLLATYRIAGVPDPEHWLFVAILESGWQIDSPLAVEHYNPIGMRARIGFAHINTSDGKYCTYPNMLVQALDLKKWCDFSPRKVGEDFTEYLKRRGYNTNKSYYVKFNEIKKLANIW